MKRLYSVKFNNKIQSLPGLAPRLTLLSSNDSTLSGVIIEVVTEIFCINVADSTLSGVVWEGEKDDEMVEGADIIKGWLDEPAKSWSENLKK